MIFKLGLVLHSSTFHNAQRRTLELISAPWIVLIHCSFLVCCRFPLIPFSFYGNWSFFYISHPFPLKFLLYPLLFLSYSFTFLPILSDFLTLFRSSFWFLIISNPPKHQPKYPWLDFWMWVGAKLSLMWLPQAECPLPSPIWVLINAG